MGVTRDRFDAVKSDWGAVGSWAVWAPPRPGEGVKSEMGDMSVLDPDANPDLLDSLTPEVVMLGINGAVTATRAPLGNFHDASGRANHFKLRHAFHGTPFWGAYLTDTFKGIPASGTKQTFAYLRAHPDVVDEQLGRLRDELDALGSEDPLLVALGGDVYGVLREHLGADFRIVKIPHYSHFITKEDYRAQSLAAIDEYLVSSSGATSAG